jgi:hypothetical protein
MPEIRTGIRLPAKTTTMSFAWDEFVGDQSSSESGMQPAEPVEPDTKDDEYLEAPRRQWIEHGGGVGTFSSGSGTTDDVELVGGTGLASRVTSKEDKPTTTDKSMLPHGRSSLQWSTEDRRNKW